MSLSGNCKLKALHGTRQSSEKNGKSKLTDEDVRHIRTTYPERTEANYAFLADKFGINSEYAADIIRRRSRGDV